MMVMWGLRPRLSICWAGPDLQKNCLVHARSGLWRRFDAAKKRTRVNLTPLAAGGLDSIIPSCPAILVERQPLEL